jgi:para-aminobenzoate synthetase/4-amino-4-deoxychorismate lyase
MTAAPPFRVLRRRLDWELSAAEVLRLVRADPHPVALLGAWAGGSDIVASSPVRVRDAPSVLADVLDAPLARPDGPPAGRGANPFGGGWIGYLGFGLAGKFLPVPPSPGEPRQLRGSFFGYYDHVLRRDRGTGRWSFEMLWTPARADALAERFGELTRRAQAAGHEPRAFSCGGFRLIPSSGEHRSAVRQAISYIRRGDIFQANICLRLEARFGGDPLDAFCQAATRLNPPYAAFLRTPDGAVASLSPELFLRRTGTTVWSQPIKGTRPRPADDQAARQERDRLERSAKDRAENVMIVDLMRNDLSRVCAPGSVRVPALLRAEAHPGVWHLVSDVRGTLRPGAGDGQLIAAAFPPGSVTGAPKVRALEIIHELEATPREVYTGAVGYRSPVAGLELNVAIRTFEFAGDRVWLGSGGGITARSDEAAEYRECLLKARPLIGALDATISAEPRRRPRGQAGIPPSLRPRPALGVFTSLRVVAGQAADLDRHLARLEASSRELFGKQLPSSLTADLAACLAGPPSGRRRISARPAGGPLQVTVEVVAAGPPGPAVTLHPVTIPGGLGAHKWRDRRLLARLADQFAPGHDGHLLIRDHGLSRDHGGEVLETDRASVFAVVDGDLLTPPADGRLLPGVTRAAVLRLARGDGLTVRETAFSEQRLRDASEVFVTNSVQGVVPVRFLAGADGADGVGWPCGPVTRRLQAGLARRPGREGPAAGPPGPVRRTGPVNRADSVRRAGRVRPGGAGPAQPAIVLVDNYDSFTYNLAHLLRSHGCQVEVVRNDEVSAQDICDCGPDGIVISPGPGTPADAGHSIDIVRACAAGTPLLGICLGHQVIAAAHGARISTAPQPVHGQAALITHDGGGVLAGLPPRFPAARYHSLIVEEGSLPPGLVITARGPGGIPMGLRHTRHPVEGLQFHPESILTPHGHDIIGNFVRVVRTASGRGQDPGARAAASRRSAIVK